MSRLEKLVADVCLELRDISPQAKVAFSYAPFEDVNATIWVCPPDWEMEEKLSRYGAERTLDILMDEGYNIAVLVYDPNGAVPTGELMVAA